MRPLKLTIGGRHRNDAALFTTVMSEMCVYMLLALTVLAPGENRHLGMRTKSWTK